MAVNLASKYSNKVDERFYKTAQSSLVTNKSYSFSGVKSVTVYSIPTVQLTDYGRSGNTRYGTASDLADTIQTMTISKDRAFTFIIDKGDKVQSMMVRDAGKALAREVREVVVPEIDSHVFLTLAKNAGGKSATAATKDNAFSLFLAAHEALGDNCAPESGLVCLCSYKFANLLKQDPAFMRYGNTSQEMLKKGVIGEVDGVRIVKVPKSRLPSKTGTYADFILTHPSACVAPMQLRDYKIHENPPGISGWLVEGRILYDAFVLNNKAPAIWYQGPALSS